jgi:hypothetical protein
VSATNGKGGMEAKMSEREPLSDQELEALSEKLLAKLLQRLSQRALAAHNDVADSGKGCEPTAEDYAAALARRRRKGR